jgi:hypothetical protein
MRWILALAVSAVVTMAGCGSVVLQPVPSDAAADASAPPDATMPPGDAMRPCRSHADCNAWEECHIREGCDVPSYCGPRLGRPCTEDLAPYCGCDGQTFMASSTCPTRVYARRGPCEARDGGPPGCRLPNGRTCPFGQTCRLDDNGCSVCSCGLDGSVRCAGGTCIDAGAPSCVLSDGRVCPVGQQCPAPDGCNTCVCNPGGMLVCSTRACADAGPPGCLLLNDAICPFGQRCMIDRCTECFCDNRGGLTCSNRCADAGSPDVVPPRSCRSSGECPRGMMCDGPAGCDVPWTCVPLRPCTADVAPFCGCDGRTFYGSSSCPGQVYRSRGGCGGGGMGGCRAQDARGDGLCDAFFGYAWDGRMCVAVTGCRCEGSDCRALSLELDACRLRYSGCRG